MVRPAVRETSERVSLEDKELSISTAFKCQALCQKNLKRELRVDRTDTKADGGFRH